MPAPSSYTGLEASLYDHFWTNEDLDDVGFHLDMARLQGGSVLDVGCGTGRILIPLSEEGIVVEGIDNAPEMLALCRKKMSAAKVKAKLHRQSMEGLDLEGRIFDTLMVPGASFQLLPDDAIAGEALRRFRQHLAPDGQLLITMFIPWFELGNDALSGHWRLHKESIRESDGARVICQTASELDRHEQSMRVWNRYEVYAVDGSLRESQLKEMQLRWYYRNEFCRFLRAAGFGTVVTYGDFQDDEANDGHSVITYRATR
jgi:SAM-dependent methyltransferase